MASYNQNGANDHNLQAMLARLGQRNGSNVADESGFRDQLSRFATLNQAHQSHGGYYGGGGDGQGHQSDDPESPLMTGSEAFFPPAAPTPPMNQFSHSQGPPGMMGMNLGPIGSLPSFSANPSDQSASLLNLLKKKDNDVASTHSSTHSHRDSQASAHGSRPFESSVNLPHSADPLTLHAPVPMPADPQGMLASLMLGNAHHENQRHEPHSAPTNLANQQWNDATGPKGNTQAYLLSLLQQKKPGQTEQPVPNEVSSTHVPSETQRVAHELGFDPLGDAQLHRAATERQARSKEHGPMRHVSLGHHQPASSPPTKHDYGSASSQVAANRKPVFDYKDPFDDLTQAPSPHNRTPKSTTSAAFSPNVTAPSFQILKKTPSATSSPAASEHKRLTSHRSPALSPEHASPAAFESSRGSHLGSEAPKEAVSTAIENIADLVDEEANDALARAENEKSQARIAQELAELETATSDADFAAKSEVVAKDILKEFEKKENAGILEDSFPPELAQAVHDIVEDAANGHLVADSWESAEADEIIVIEEAAVPVKVYNFPMKPWISITLQENEETRPQFRDEVILDIARVKKEFDQIDRNLVSATETYIVYGMSKAGGFRVIRQDDGRDAKLFTDTKDRIFNVAVCATPSDLDIPQKESIIGTGISGTVYYGLMKNGDKDYLDDAHPEQYGFALPPISIHEGDVPGGVLKTRARTSAIHPEYFAVGRGKTISIVWPSYIMQNSLFKPGHDRVVDTEKLSKQCSLRINTGKAGKDFTFSRDDTTIVSLDKSGRVKFWDIRDLTSPDKESDPRYPMPAHTSFEVKEPLMTLTTTPEGEKAWPTSVLLLDKQRPYQKRCALRYMIVGMKQNHTLQLWDLALGKPVQEFNLPHTKESDAVCSVTYHPPTGMIVVGHPTRNSIYFLHLSAPKYTIKGLSQVDFIQKLVAKDPSMPDPDSTAVISGVREYNFSNRGVIRSLDMLTTPAAVSEDEEQTLFELYAMHSKGISGIFIKQSELGWTKDNKVVAPVDAVEAGIVKINKLKELPANQHADSQVIEDNVTLPIRSAGRSSTRDKEQNQPTSGEDVSRDALDDGPTPPERKSADTTAAPATTDKAERKSRKKKEKAAAAAAAAAAEKNALSNDNANAQPTPANVNPSKNGEVVPSPNHTNSAVSSDSFQTALKQVEMTVGNAVEQALRENRQKTDQEMRNRAGVFKKSQQNLLETISSTLENNVQGVLTGTVNTSISQHVLPALEEVLRQTVAEQVSRVVSDQLDAKIGGRISHAVQNQMQKLLPNAVGQALLKSDISKIVAGKVAESLSTEVNSTFQETLNDNITPTFSRMAVAAATKMVDDVQRHAAGQIEAFEQKALADSQKIDQLSKLVSHLSETVSNMAKSQGDFQARFLSSREEVVHDRHPHSQAQVPRHLQYPPQSSSQSMLHHNQSFNTQSEAHNQAYNSPSAHSGNQLVVQQLAPGPSGDPDVDRKIADIASQVRAGETEGALVRWLQSDRKEEIFHHFWASLDVDRLDGLSPLVGLAVIAELAQNLESHKLRQKIDWMTTIVKGLHDALPGIDSQVREVIPNILGGYTSQMESLYKRIASTSAQDSIVQRILQSIGMARRVIDAARTPYHGEY